MHQYQRILTVTYASFLVFVTPLAIPLAVWTWMQGWATTSDVALCVIMYCISGLGITLGYHRLLTHRAFSCQRWFKLFLLVSGTFAMQGGPASWASLHIQHHRFADKDGDPHSPVHGFWHSHCGWIFDDYEPDFRRYGKWLLEDNDVKHISKNYLYYSLLGLLIPFVIGGWVGLLWGGFLRILICSHMTWCVNSVCHKFGYQSYEVKDTSTNNPFVALLTFGEGWHNNHHRFMQMPFFGHRWYEIDMGKWVLQALRPFKVVWGFKGVKETESMLPSA